MALSAIVGIDGEAIRSVPSLFLGVKAILRHERRISIIDARVILLIRPATYRAALTSRKP
jgi:hypothetical protein